MGPPVAHFGASGRWDFPPEVLAAYKRDNLQMEVMFPITWGGRWDYPYPEAQDLIRGMRDLFGAGKLVWGSDMPNVERFCTYKQSLDYVSAIARSSPPRRRSRSSAGTPPSSSGSRPDGCANRD